MALLPSDQTPKAGRKFFQKKIFSNPDNPTSLKAMLTSYLMDRGRMVAMVAGFSSNCLTKPGWELQQVAATSLYFSLSFLAYRELPLEGKQLVWSS